MSPRAAWRLEAFGYVEVHDYVAGKAYWRAAGLATEGRPPPSAPGVRGHGPRAADLLAR